MCLVLWFITASTASLFGQKPTDQSLPGWQNEQINRYANLRNQTLRLAQRHGWPQFMNYSSQRQLRLQEVDAFGEPVYYTLHNAEAAKGTHTQALYSGGSLGISLSGSSAAMAGRLAIWDGGKLLGTHQELMGSSTGQSRISQKDKATELSDHATHVAGTLMARGMNGAAKGMAFGAQLLTWDYTDDLTELTTAAPGLLLSNHAYGPVVGWVYNPSRPGTDPNQKWEWWGTPAINDTEDYLFGFYTAKARDLDRVAYNNPFYLMVRSADNKRSENGPPIGTPYFLKNTVTKSTVPRSRNDGYDVIPAEATAKNVLTVGAADIPVDANGQHATMATAPFSGWGPTDDGRIKPDLLGIGTNVFSTLSTSDTAYGTYTGTSMASANVSGSLFLLQELFAQQRTGNTPANAVFMRSATLRGLAIHTADRFSPVSGPDYRQGWGLLNTEAAARVIINANLAHQVIERSLIAGSTFTQRLVAQGSEPLIVTLCWSDPEGTAAPIAAESVNSRNPKLVNDLDLRLSDDRAATMPFALDPDHPDRPAVRGDNTRDNVEQVYVANPVPGQGYLISVSHKGRMTYGNQPFSVIVSGLRRTTCGLIAAVTPANDTAFCDGSALTLSAVAQPTFSYQWLRNGISIADANEATLQIRQPGSYTLRLTDGTGCSAVSKPVQVSVRALAVTINPAGSQWLCTVGQPIILTASSTVGSRIDWLRNGAVIDSSQAPSILVTGPGHYQVRAVQNGCTVFSGETVVQPTTVDSLLVLPEETDLTLIAGATVTLKAPLDTTYRYQWYRNGLSMANATEHQLSVAQSGVYKVEVRQQNCVGVSSERSVHLAVVTATTPDPNPTFVLFPNPAEAVISVHYASLTTNQLSIRVLDGRGISVRQPVIIRSVGGRFEGDVPVSGLPPGHYTLQLFDGAQTQTRRFVKR